MLPGNNCCAVAAPVPAVTKTPASFDKNCVGFAAPLARGPAMGAPIPTSSAIRPIIAVIALVLSYSVSMPKLFNIFVTSALPRNGFLLMSLEDFNPVSTSNPASSNTLRTPVSPRPITKLDKSAGNPKVKPIPFHMP